MGCAQTILGFTTAAPTVVDELSSIYMVMRWLQNSVALMLIISKKENRFDRDSQVRIWSTTYRNSRMFYFEIQKWKCFIALNINLISTKECEELASRLFDSSHQVLGSDGILPCIIEMCFTGLSHLTCYIDGRPSQLVCFKKKRLLLSVASRAGFEPTLQVFKRTPANSLLFKRDFCLLGSPRKGYIRGRFGRKLLKNAVHQSK